MLRSLSPEEHDRLLLIAERYDTLSRSGYVQAALGVKNAEGVDRYVDRAIAKRKRGEGGDDGEDTVV